MNAVFLINYYVMRDSAVPVPLSERNCGMEWFIDDNDDTPSWVRCTPYRFAIPTQSQTQAHCVTTPLSFRCGSVMQNDVKSITYHASLTK